ncbi:MAG: copper amine oxidase N-terminal domain-containing protein [Lachnospirales bacterium]
MDNTNYDEYITFLTENEYANIVNNLQIPQIEDVNTIKEENLVVDGVITDIEYINVADGRVVVPLRDTFEYLGYDVVWNNDTRSVDLTNGAIFTSVTLGVDNYAYGKMAPVNLGLAPMLIDEVTYVPVEIFTQVFPYEYQYASNGYLSLVTE